MTAPIDTGGPSPFPPPPAEWRPRDLVRAEMAPLEEALRARVERVAMARGVTMADAAAVVLGELNAKVTP